MSNFDDKTIEAVWGKGIIIPGTDIDVIRKDAAGAIIKKTDRGGTTEFSWEIDHVCPKAMLKERGIPEDQWDDLRNLRPFNTANNKSKSDDYPQYTRAKVKIEGRLKNMDSKTRMIVNAEVLKRVNECYGFSDEGTCGKQDDA